MHELREAQSHSKSEALLARARRVMPGGVSSPVRSFKAVPTRQVVLVSGQGARVTDADGRERIDLQMAFGPHILGHADPRILAAIARSSRASLGFGATTPDEIALAETLLDALPGCERIRFVCSGTEAVMAALRVARGTTGRPLIVKFEGGYHGHADALLVEAGSGLATFGAPSSAGVPPNAVADTRVLPLADLARAEELFRREGDRIAAVVIEPVPANNGLLRQEESYLRALRALARKHGALFIADEVITGFRLGWGSHAQRLGLEPDLIALGKIIGGGMPVGAYAGRHELMKLVAPEGPVYQAGTLAGHPVGMAAGLACLRALRDEPPYELLEQRAAALARGANERARAAGVKATFLHEGSIVWVWCGDGEPPRAAAAIDARAVQRFGPLHRALFDEGLWWPPSPYEVAFLSLAHDDEVLAAVLAALERALARVARDGL